MWISLSRDNSLMLVGFVAISCCVKDGSEHVTLTTPSWSLSTGFLFHFQSFTLGAHHTLSKKQIWLFHSHFPSFIHTQACHLCYLIKSKLFSITVPGDPLSSCLCLPLQPHLAPTAAHTVSFSNLMLLCFAAYAKLLLAVLPLVWLCSLLGMSFPFVLRCCLLFVRLSGLP